MKYLFIAEKPSLMQECKQCYEKHKDEIIAAVGEIDFVALAGHVCRFCEPDSYEIWHDSWNKITYPMIPNNWLVDSINDTGKKKIIKHIKDSLPYYSGVIVGTDGDQEGYGIYYLLEKYLHLENTYALRFIEHSLTDKEILASLLNMTEIHTDPVHIRATNAYKLRAQADWLYGMNATRMMSTKSNYTARVGRVIAPTVKLVYDNSIAIRDFKPRTYYTIRANYGTFEAVLVDAEGKNQEFDAICDLSFIPLQGQIYNKESQRQQTHAPKLYDLSSLQAEAGKMYGYTPAEVMELIQSLYEKHKAVSYPRTQCRYVSEEKAKEFPVLLQSVRVFEELAPYVNQITDEDMQRVFADKEVVNTKEVEKESHDALLPTGQVPNISLMTDKEKNILDMIYRRLLAEFLPKLEEEKTKMEIMHGGYLFKADGKVVTNQGWKVLYKEGKDKLIPALEVGNVINAETIQCHESVTKPPKRLTQATLLSAMKNIANQIKDPELKKSLADSQGIGTPSSRHTIIENIIKTGYAVDKKGLYITDVGIAYIQSLESINICDPTFAAVMDTNIKKVQRGESSYDEEYNKIINDLNVVCQQIDAIVPPPREYLKQTCLICNSPLYVGRYHYMCSNDGCEFKIPLSAYKKVITKELLEQLYTNSFIGPFNDLSYKDKEGKVKQFRAKFVLDKEKGIRADYSSGLNCPFCNNEVNATIHGYFCQCGLKIYNPFKGKRFTDDDIATLFRDGFLPESAKYKYKKKDENGKYTGDPYTAKLVLYSDKTLKFDFPEKQDEGIAYPTNHICPFCNSQIQINDVKWFCTCGFSIRRNAYGRDIDDNIIHQLITNRQTEKISLYSEKKQKHYESFLILNDNKKVTLPPFEKKKRKTKPKTDNSDLFGGMTPEQLFKSLVQGD